MVYIYLQYKSILLVHVNNKYELTLKLYIYKCR